MCMTLMPGFTNICKLYAALLWEDRHRNCAFVYKQERWAARCADRSNKSLTQQQITYAAPFEIKTETLWRLLNVSVCLPQTANIIQDNWDIKTCIRILLLQVWLITKRWRGASTAGRSLQLFTVANRASLSRQCSESTTKSLQGKTKKSRRPT
jgi:hypothetical protein